MKVLHSITGKDSKEIFGVYETMLEEEKQRGRSDRVLSFVQFLATVYENNGYQKEAAKYSRMAMQLIANSSSKGKTATVSKST
jgi:hypothetical protein